MRKITSTVIPDDLFEIKNCPFDGEIKLYFYEGYSHCELEHTSKEGYLSSVATRFYYFETYISYNYWYYDKDGNIVENYYN